MRRLLITFPHFEKRTIFDSIEENGKDKYFYKILLLFNKIVLFIMPLSFHIFCSSVMGDLEISMRFLMKFRKVKNVHTCKINPLFSVTVLKTNFYGNPAAFNTMTQSIVVVWCVRGGLQRHNGG